MKSFVSFFREGKSGEISRNVFCEKPELFDITISNPDDLMKWRDDYERNLTLEKDHMKIAVILNDRILKKRRLHIRYYFCVSKYEVYKPKPKKRDEYEEDEESSSKDYDFWILNRPTADTLLCLCTKYSGLIIDEVGLNPVRYIDRKGLYDIEGIYQKVLEEVPRIYRRYTRDESGTESPAELGWLNNRLEEIHPNPANAKSEHF